MVNQSGIQVVPYNEQWEREFFNLERVLTEALGDCILGIEHVGSTSVRGLSSKPIIDIDIVIENSQIFSKVCQGLNELGYIHEGDLGIKGREAFNREDHTVPRRGNSEHWMEQHIYVCTKDNQGAL